MPRRVAVLKGGWSAEREVSLVSGAAVERALAERGHAVVAIDVRQDLPALLAALEPRPDVVFNALHGRGGEDGVIQGVLEMLGLPYTHSGVLASAIAMNKPLTKALVTAAGVQCAEGIVAAKAEVATRHVMAPPYVVKPPAEGSSFGVRIVRAGDNAPPIDVAEWPFGDEVLVERYVPGRELTVGVLGDRPLTVTEVTHSHAFLDYEAKYTEGHAVHTLPAPVPELVFQAALDAALTAHRVLGCQGVSRSDFRFDETAPAGRQLYFLEINTQPGFTPISFVPEQARFLGIPFGEVCEILLEQARCHA